MMTVLAAVGCTRRTREGPSDGVAGQRVPARVTLTGAVTSASGPIADATVFVHTAAPKQGTSSTCPSCYLDCRKRARTTADGRFTIPALDARLRFTLLVVAKGYAVKLVPRVDPAAGAQTISLETRDLAALPPGLIVRSRVLGPDIHPVRGAVVEVKGVTSGSTTRHTGHGVDEVVITDEDGAFALASHQPVSRIYATVEAASLAKRTVVLSPGQNADIKLVDGASLVGRLLDRGRPIAGAEIAMVQQDRAPGAFLGPTQAMTDAQGRFVFVQVPPGLEVFVYGRMESLGTRGQPALVTAETGADHAMTDLGNLSVRPVHVVAGRIVLTDARPMPAGTRIHLSRQEAWDWLEAEVSPDGHFRFEGVPPEPVALSTRVKGYRFSSRNPSLDWLNDRIVGTVTGDLAELTLELAPENERLHMRKPADGVDSQPLERPLLSADLH